MTEKLLTLMELAKALQTNRERIYAWIGEGMPHVELSPKSRRFILAEVLAWFRHKNDSRKDAQ